VVWHNPKYPRPEPAKPPDDEGERLAAIPRNDGREELRVTLKSYEGRPYVALRVWEKDDRGRYWPVKNKGCSVRISEAAAVADALTWAVAGQGAARPERAGHDDDRPRFVDKRRPQRADWRGDAPSLPKASEGDGFDEFRGDLG
jgi:hypothetical protein